LVAVMGGLYGIAVYRETHPEPEVTRLIEVLGLRAGMTVAEIGAGEGRMTLNMARRLGPGSHVFSSEIDPQLIRDLEKAIAKASLENVTLIEASDRATNLPEGCCDAIWMSKVYHHLTDPVAVDASVVQALRPGGRLAVIEFAPSRWRFWLRQPNGVPQNRGGHGIPERILVEELTHAGLRVERVIGDWWVFPDTRYCVVFRKPT